MVTRFPQWLLIVFLATTSTAQTPRTATLPTPDVTLTTYTYGTPKPHTAPVIAVNGGPGLSHIYLVQNDLWTARIPAHRQVILYDQRGTGASPLTNPNAPQTMEAQVADLEAVRASLHADKIHLLGDSYGGLLVSAYAAAHPEHVLTLTLSDSAAPGFAALHPRLDEAFPDVVAQTKSQIAHLSGPDQDRQAAILDINAHMRMIFYSPELAERYLRQAPVGIGIAPAAGEAVSKAIGKLDLTAQMAKFRFPVLILQGRYDLNVTPDVSYAVAHHIPGAQLVLFEHSGHLPYYEEPEKYATTLETFLEAHDPKAH